jgi:prepilin-type N-terminal cleavage/methylation domain-containing protein
MHHRPKSSPQSGYNLLEMTVVLVIVSLLIGGVTVGKFIIEAAQIRNQVTDLQRYMTATSLFINKYGYLPGDIPDSVGVPYGLPAVNGTNSGQGNGWINTFTGPGFSGVSRSPISEPAAFFVDLGAAKLIPGTYTYDPTWTKYLVGPGTQPGTIFPPIRINPQYGITVSSPTKTELWFFLGISNPGTYSAAVTFNNLSTKGVLTPAQAYAIDAKMDDGTPSTGTVRAVIPNAASYVLDGTLDKTAAACVVDATAQNYNTGNINLLCRLFIDAQVGQ